jgi:3',5'-cyclic AMP phosphodiesterase CpdA
MSIRTIETTIKIGLETPVRVLHMSDTHLTRADLRDGERKVALGEKRSQYYRAAEDVLRAAAELSAREQIPILHTGDLADFVSEANLEIARDFVCETDCFLAAGNHEFSQYVGEAIEDEAYRNQSLARVQAVYQNDIRASSRVIGGVNFVALDNGYYQFDEGQLAFLQGEVKRGLPIVLMFHTPLYEPVLCDIMRKKRPCAYLVAVPDEIGDTYTDDRMRLQLANEVTKRTVEYIQNEKSIRAILAGHLHIDYEGVFGDRIPQITTDCEHLRLVTFA